MCYSALVVSCFTLMVCVVFCFLIIFTCWILHEEASSYPGSGRIGVTPSVLLSRLTQSYLIQLHGSDTAEGKDSGYRGATVPEEDKPVTLETPEKVKHNLRAFV